ncbi:MAG: hypothetical protein GXO63_00545 [Candidatus Micrarchaeota archaeon]|nr:hypothetical protein [Candidatus Micrarchaeota archaeon]
MIHPAELVLVYASIGFALLSIVFIFLSLRLTREAVKKKMLGSIFNLKYEKFESFWKWVFLIPFIIILSRAIELVKEIQGFEFVNGFYRLFDFFIILIIFVLVVSYYYIFKSYMK